MTAAFVLVIALVLDALLGEPKWLWDRARHPAVLMGQLVSYLDESLNRPRKRKAKGVLTVAILVTVGAVVGGLLSAFGPFVEILVVAVLIAQRSLVDHVNDVARGLESSVIEGRHAVSMIVSRDTDMMTGPQVARSAIESGSENFSDGVVAPAFWFLVAGLPGLVIYKMVNTADSMIGYRNDRYESFGWAAARLDDVLNWIPARLTGLLIALVGGQLRQWSDIMIDAGKHRSPNAGWPEAAMARTLGLSLAGPRSYDGQMRHFAWVNETGAKGIGAHAIRRCTDKLWQAWAAGLGLTVAFALVF